MLDRRADRDEAGANACSVIVRLVELDRHDPRRAPTRGPSAAPRAAGSRSSRRQQRGVGDDLRRCWGTAASRGRTAAGDARRPPATRVAGLELVGGVELDRHRDRLRRRAPERGARPAAAGPLRRRAARGVRLTSSGLYWKMTIRESGLCGSTATIAPRSVRGRARHGAHAASLRRPVTARHADRHAPPRRSGDATVTRSWEGLLVRFTTCEAATLDPRIVHHPHDLAPPPARRLTDFPTLVLLTGSPPPGRTIRLQPGAQRLLAFLPLHDRPLSALYVAGRLWTDSDAGAREREPAHDAVAPAPPGMRARRVDGERGGPGRRRRRRRARDRSPGRTACSSSAPRPRTSRRSSPRATCCPTSTTTGSSLERERFRQLRLHALERLCEDLTAAGSYAAAAEAGFAAIASEPLRESAHRASSATTSPRATWARRSASTASSATSPATISACRRRRGCGR